MKYFFLLNFDYVELFAELRRYVVNITLLVATGDFSGRLIRDKIAIF